MKKQKNNPETSILDISNIWSARALRMIHSLPNNAKIFELYWWHWSNLGKNKQRGFPNYEDGIDFIGLKTYEEIRKVLLRNKFPDLSDKMFSPSGFCSKCCPKSLLKRVLTIWPLASRKGRNVLRKEMLACDCDGH